MSVRYRAEAGQMIDEICWHYYGRTDGGVVEQVLEANPGLAGLGPRLPRGTEVVLPAIEEAATPLVELWD